MSASFNANGTVTGTTITASTQFSGSGAGITGISGSQVTLGANNAPVITNGSGGLTTETTLATSRGGTGTNSSSSTGIPHVASGTWTYSGIASSDLAGGFAVTNSQTTATSANTPSTIVARDGSGNFAASNITSTVETQNAVNISPNGITTIQATNVQTTNATVTAILSLTTVNSSVYAAQVLISCIDTSDTGNNTGVISYIVKAATGSGGSVSISSLANYTTILDSNVSTIASTVTSSGTNNLTINVQGVSSKNIDWLVKIITLSQT